MIAFRGPHDDVALNHEQPLIEFTGRLDIAGALGSEETAMFLYDVDPGESLPYPAGPEGAHQVANRSDAAARVMLFSKVAVPAVSVYPDTDTIGVWPDDDTEYYFKRGTAIPRDVG